MTCICGHSYHAGVGGSCLTEGCPCFKLRYNGPTKSLNVSGDVFVTAGHRPDVPLPRWARVIEHEMMTQWNPGIGHIAFLIASYPMRSEAVQ